MSSVVLYLLTLVTSFIDLAIYYVLRSLSSFSRVLTSPKLSPSFPVYKQVYKGQFIISIKNNSNFFKRSINQCIFLWFFFTFSFGNVLCTRCITSKTLLRHPQYQTNTRLKLSRVFFFYLKMSSVYWILRFVSLNCSVLLIGVQP